MKTKIKSIIETSKDTLIKVRLDYRTLVTITNMAAFEMWQKRFPEAKIIS
jgi:molybdopterin-binding protein